MDVFINFGGGHYQNSWQHLPGGLPLTSSSTSVVAAIDAPSSTPRVPTIDVLLNYGGGHYRNS
jgi:hypothetical protein